MLTAVATADNTIEAMRLGAADHLTKPVGRTDLAALLRRMLPTGVAASRAAPREPRQELVGASSAMREVQKTIGLLADSEATVLIAGETGTGKEIAVRGDGVESCLGRAIGAQAIGRSPEQLAPLAAPPPPR